MSDPTNDNDIFQGKSPFKGFRREAVNALDFAKSVAVDPEITAKPENQAALKDLLACIARADEKPGRGE